MITKTIEEEYLVIIGKGNLWPLKDRFKDLGGFYTGSFWAFPIESEIEIHKLLEHFNEIQIHKQPMPPGQTFKSYRHTFTAKFFKKKLKEIEEEISRKTEHLNIDEISEEIVDSLNIQEWKKTDIIALLQQRNYNKFQMSHNESMAKALTNQATSTQELDKQLDLESEETVEGFIKIHKETFSKGVLISGYGELDKRLFYAPGDLVIVQGMSNHGKTKWMEQKAYNFLTNNRNIKKNPICIFISFENSPLFVKQDFLNLISKNHNEGEKFISYYSSYFEEEKIESPFLYPNFKTEFGSTILEYEKLKKNQNLIFLENIQFNDLQPLISKLQQKHLERPIAIFLDYVQILPTNLDSDGWEKIKEISYGLEKLAQQNKILVIAGSQVNDDRKTREGKDIYNAATIVEDVFNHSHSALEMGKETKKDYREQVDGKNVISITITKYKRGHSFTLKEAFLFDGHAFTLKEDSQYLAPVVNKPKPKDTPPSGYKSA